MTVRSKAAVLLPIHVCYVAIGMIGAMVRHMKSLRRMTRDHGWIHVHLAGGGRE